MQKTGGATALMYACQQCNETDVLDILSKEPDSVRQRDRTMKTPLHYCAENSSPKCAEAILTAHPDLVNAQDENGYCPLHLAVIAGNKPLTRLLVERGANVNLHDNEGHSAVHWAIVSSEKEALEMIVDAGADPSTSDVHGGHPLHYAVQMCGANNDNPKKLGDAIRVVQTLLRYGVNVNVTDKDGRQPILWAASAGSSKAIVLLINSGARVDAADKDGLTALHCAASRGHTDTIQTLVTHCGAEVDVIDGNGCSALFYAVTLGHADSTAVLLRLGAEPNRQDRKGRTPAHCGAAKGQLETLRILKRHGGNLWLRNVRGDLPFHEAVASGRKDLVLWFLEENPDAVNIGNNDGRCALHVAAMYNNTEMIKLLLDHKSMVNPVMRSGRGVLMTPLNVALGKGHKSCGKLLQLHGGVPFSKVSKSDAKRVRSDRISPSHKNNVSSVGVGEWREEIVSPSFTVIQTTHNGTHQVIVENGERKKVQRRRKKRKSSLTDKRYYNGDSDSEDSVHEVNVKAQTHRSVRGSKERSDDSDGEEGRAGTGGKHVAADGVTSIVLTDDNVYVHVPAEESEDKSEAAVGGKASTLSPGDFPPTMETVNRLGSGIAEIDRSKSPTVIEVPDKEVVLQAQATDTTTMTTASPNDVSDEKSAGKRNGQTANGHLSPAFRILDDGSETTTPTTGNEKSDKSDGKKVRKTAEKSGGIVHTKTTTTTTTTSHRKYEKTTKTTRRKDDKHQNGTKDEKVTKSGVKSKASGDEKTTKKESEASEKKTAEVVEPVKPDEPVAEATTATMTTTVVHPDVANAVAIVEEKITEIVRVDQPVLAEAETETKPSETTTSAEAPEPETAVESTEAVGELQSRTNNNGTEDTGKDPEGHGEVSQAANLEKAEDPVAVEPAAVAEETTEAARDYIEVPSPVKQTPAVMDVVADVHATEPVPEKTDEKSENVAEAQESKVEESVTPEVAPDATTEPVVTTEDIIVTNSEQEHLETASDPVEEVDAHKRNTKPIEPSATMTTTTVTTNPTKPEPEPDPEPEVPSIERKMSSPPEEATTTTVPDPVPSNESNKMEEESVAAAVQETNTVTNISNDISRPEPETVDEIQITETENLLVGETTRGGNGESAENPEADVEPEPEIRQKRSLMSPTNESNVAHCNDDVEEEQEDEDTNNWSVCEERVTRLPRVPRLCRRHHKDFRDVGDVSVTQLVQGTIRKYHLERGIFHQLLELKRLQIRAGRANEQVLVKRLVDEYEKSCASLGMKHYTGSYKFKEFEKFLYEQLKKLNKGRGVVPDMKSYDDIDALSGILKKSRFKVLSEFGDGYERQCACLTQRCHHSTRAYTTLPCSAYVANLRHQKMKRHKREGFLPRIDQKSPYKSERDRFETGGRTTLELIQGQDKKVIELPKTHPEKSKKYYITLIIKSAQTYPQSDGDDDGGDIVGDDPLDDISSAKDFFKHRHAKSV